MFLPLKKVAYTVIFNFSLFLILIIGIQNSSKKSKVNLVYRETISFPTSFIIGVSFISGSILGSILQKNTRIK